MEVKAILFILVFCFSLYDTFIHLAVKDFVIAQKFPTKVSALVCWKIEARVKFSKLLTNARIQNEITNQLKSGYFIPEHQLFLLDMDCDESYNTLQKADKLGLFVHPYRWLVFSKSSRKFTLQRNLNLLADSRFWSMNACDNGSFCVKYLHKYSKRDESYLQSDFGIWTSDRGFVFYDEYIFPGRKRVDLNGTFIRTTHVVTHNETLEHLCDSRHRHIDAITKVNYILMHHLMDFINATRRFYIQTTWGYKNAKTGIYSGMIGDLQTGASDMGGTPAFFTKDRIDVIDYIAFTTPTLMRILFRSPPLSYVSNVFVMPFDAMVWYGCLLMVMITPFALFAIVKWEWKEPIFRQTIADMQTALRGKFSDVVMFEISAVSQQGYDVEPKSISGRIAAIFTFITLMFLYTSYSANIVALLQSTADNIRTLDDLQNSRIKLGVEDIVYSYHYFNSNNIDDPIKKKLYETKIAPKGQPANFMSIEEGIQRVRDEFFGFHVELSNGYKMVADIFMEHQKCGLKEVAFLHLTEPALSAPKNSSYKELFKLGMRKINEHGLQNREVRRVYTRKPICHNKGSNFVSVGLRDCYFPFVVIIGGVVASTLLLLMELAVWNYYLRHKRTSICRKLQLDK